MKQIILCILALAATSLRAQDMKVEALHIVKNHSAINPYVVDSTLYFATDLKSEFVKTHLDGEGNNLFHLYKMKLRNRKPRGSMTAVFTDNQRSNQVAITRSGSQFYITQNSDDETNINDCKLLSFYQCDPNLDNAQPVMRQPHMSNIATPSISENGKLMIFASDMPGGEGSSDLYMCERNSVFDMWGTPINLGTTINTRGAETSPFIHPSGKIFFASNGRKDSKKLDIYYTYRTKNGFAEPVRYDSNVNTSADEYGIYVSDDEEWGYVTSARYGYDMIFYFYRGFPSFPESNEWVEDNYCFTLYEASTDNYDPSMFTFRWTVNDGFSAYGAEVDHCFDGPGEYMVALSVLDKTSNEELFSIAEFPLELVRTEQVDIEAPRRIRQGQEVTFRASADAIKSFTPKGFYWDFGKLGKLKGQTVKRKFTKKGTYRVSCGTIAEEDKNVRLCTWIELIVE